MPDHVPLAKEVCLIASNFGGEYASFTLDLEHLKFLLLPQSESDISGFWECNDLLLEGFGELIENDAISSSELIHNQLPVTLKPHASMCLHLKWVQGSFDEIDKRLMSSALARISRAFKTTEFEPSSGRFVFSPSDDEITDQLQNNYFFMKLTKVLRSVSQVSL